jgi:CBS domain-containing protein
MTQAPDTVGEIMTSGVVTVGPDQPVREAVTAMIEHDIGCVVISEGDRALGVFTERDLTRHVLDDGAVLDRPVGELMSGPPVTAASADEIVFVFERMTGRGIRRLPVVDDGRLVGIVTERDLLRWVGEVASE